MHEAIYDEMCAELAQPAGRRSSMTVERPGYFIRPTIVRDIAEGSRLADEEQFGPVLPVLKYSGTDEAIRRATRAAVTPQHAAVPASMPASIPCRRDPGRWRST